MNHSTNAILADLTPSPRLRAAARAIRTRRWGFGLAAFGAALTGIGFVADHTLGGAAVPVRTGLVEAEARVLTLERAEASLTEESASLTRALRLAEEIGAQPDWSYLLAILAHEVGDTVWLESVELALQSSSAVGVPPPGATSRGPFSLAVSGGSVSQPEVSRFVLSLERTSIFSDVSLVESSRTPDGQVRFRIACRVGGFDPEDQT